MTWLNRIFAWLFFLSILYLAAALLVGLAQTVRD